MTIRAMFVSGRSRVTPQADAGLVLSLRRASDTDAPFASAVLIFYQVGDGSGRGGEVWELTNGSGDNKLGDWLDPNDASGDFYVQFSNLTGDTPGGSSFDSWHKIGGTSSANRTVTLSGSSTAELCNFDVEMGRDGATALTGPFSWQVDIDST